MQRPSPLAVASNLHKLALARLADCWRSLWLDSLGGLRPHWRHPPRLLPGGLPYGECERVRAGSREPLRKGLPWSASAEAETPPRPRARRRGSIRSSDARLSSRCRGGESGRRAQYLLDILGTTDRLPPLCICEVMQNVNTTYLALWFILTRPGLVVALDNGHLLKYDQEKACILYHNPNARKQIGWYLARGAMQWAKEYRLASVDTYHWTLSPYSEEDMARFLYEQGLTWWRP